MDFNLHVDNQQDADGLNLKIFFSDFRTHTLKLVLTRDVDEIELIHSEASKFISDYRFLKLILNLKKKYEYREISIQEIWNIKLELHIGRIFTSDQETLFEKEEEVRTVQNLSKK